MSDERLDSIDLLNTVGEGGGELNDKHSINQSNNSKLGRQDSP